MKRLSYQAPTVTSDANSTLGGTLPVPLVSEKPKQVSFIALLIIIYTMHIIELYVFHLHM